MTPKRNTGKANFRNCTIWTSDNLDVMRGMNSESVDLIYLDPPFNSKANYAAPVGSKAAGAAFKDTWTLRDVDAEWINLIKSKHPALHRVLLATLTNSDKSYLAYMAVRLLEIKRLLKDTSSVYLHCDPTMSHYLKLVMDSIFGKTYFRNEIVWCYNKWSNKSNAFQANHDVILAYGSPDATFNPQYVVSTDKQAKLGQGYQINKIKGVRQLIVYDWSKAKQVPESRYDKVVNRTSANPGSVMPDHWNDINILNSQASERTGYPTQKPLALLERIIKAGSNPGDMVFDPFCGCATTLVAADRLQRQWAGIDISPKAVELVKIRLKADRGVEGLVEDVIPRTDIPQRTDLGKLPRYDSPENRKRLYGEQGGHCAGCTEHFESRHLEIDHIISRSKGGTDHIENLQLLCGSCNRIKGDRGMEYLRIQLQL